MSKKNARAFLPVLFPYRRQAAALRLSVRPEHKPGFLARLMFCRQNGRRSAADVIIFHEPI
jgi:hypothetical protein